MPRSQSVSGSLLVLGLLGLCAVMYLRLNADSISTKFVAGKLNDALRNSKLKGSVGSVIFNPGAGFEIKDVRIRRRDTQEELLKVERMLVAMPTGARELAQLEFKANVSRISPRRSAVGPSRTDASWNPAFVVGGGLEA